MSRQQAKKKETKEKEKKKLKVAKKRNKPKSKDSLEASEKELLAMANEASKVLEARALKKKAPDPKDSNVVPIRGGLPVEVLGADETYAHNIHLKIIDLMKKYEETYFALAQALYEVKAKKLYRVLGHKYNTFQDYVEALSIDYRKSKYLTRMWWWYGIEQNANPKLLEGAQEIGWSKAKELIEVVDGRNAKRWFKLAKDMNVVDLGRAAKVAKKSAEEKRKEKAKARAKDVEKKAREKHLGNGNEEEKEKEEKEEPEEYPAGMKSLDPKPPKSGKVVAPEGLEEPYENDVAEGMTEGIDPPEDIESKVEERRKTSEEWKRYMFDVHQDNWPTVKSALKYAGEIAESEHGGHLLSLICLHFNSFHDGIKEVVIGEWLARLERLTGLSIVALNPKTDTIVYGAEFIDALVAQGDKDACE